MGSIILLLIIAVAAALVLAIIIGKTRKDAGDTTWPFHAKTPLSRPEQVLYFRLVQALPEHIVLAQVQLSRLLGIDKGHNHQAWLNRINRMSADFVVCHRDFGIAAVVELDDATHHRADRHAADEKKNKALASASIRVVRWQAKALPELTVIRSTLVPEPLVRHDQAPAVHSTLTLNPE